MLDENDQWLLLLVLIETDLKKSNCKIKNDKRFATESTL